jgi:quinol monooxygenase YgiN
MADTIRVTLELTLKPEAIDAFCAQIPEALGETRKFPGFVDISIHRQLDDATRVMFLEEWETRAAYEAYVKFRTETGMMDQMAQILSQPPCLVIWDKRIA